MWARGPFRVNEGFPHRTPGARSGDLRVTSDAVGAIAPGWRYVERADFIPRSCVSRGYQRDQPPPHQGGTSWQHGRSRRPLPPSRPASTPTRSRLASPPQLSRTRRTRRAPCSEPGSVSPLPVLRRRWHSCGNAWLSARKRCGRRDLNPHALRHRNLNPACIPISPLPRVARVYPWPAAWRGTGTLVSGITDEMQSPADEAHPHGRFVTPPLGRQVSLRRGIRPGMQELRTAIRGAPPAGWLARRHHAPAQAPCPGARTMPRAPPMPRLWITSDAGGAIGAG